MQGKTEKNVECRLMIEKITLENFKSYAGTQTIGPFHPNFSSIVGPNGSGKSNLIESLLFIFGFSASWMRLNKLAQLIHSSSSSGHNSKAAVEVHFQKITHDHHIHECFVLRRVVNANSTSKYYIDNKQTTQAEVKAKLRGEGIDLQNNRFLILQGEVEQISQMKCKSGDPSKPGFLQYLEDIIGSNQYIQEIEDLASEYVKKEEIKHEKGEVIKHIEQQLTAIEYEKAQSLTYIKAYTAVNRLQNIYLQLQKQTHQHDIKLLQTQYKQLEGQKQSIIKEQKQKLKQQTQRIKEIKKNRVQIQKLQSEISEKKQDMERLNIADKNITQDIVFKTEDVVKYGKKLEAFDKDVLELMKSSEQMKEKLPKLSEQLQELGEEIEQLTYQLAPYENPERKNQIRQVERGIEKKQFELKIMKNELVIKEKNCETLSLTNQQLNNRASTEAKKLNENATTLAKIISAENHAKSLYQTIKTSTDNMEKEKLKISNQIVTINNSLKDISNQIKSASTMSNIFTEIHKQGFDDVLGRLGDMGSVPKAYNQIITTCLGNRLDNIVVRTFQAAQRVVQFLKIHKLGRVSCIILDRIRQYGTYMRKQTEELPDCVRLFDVIQAESEEVRVAFYFCIGDTIYCEDSQRAMEYAFGDDRNRRRVIARKQNGYIIYQLNGLMNGCPKRKDGFQNKTQKNTTTLKNQITSLEQRREQQHKKLNHMNKQISSNASELEIIQTDLSKITHEKQLLEQQRKQLLELLQDIQKQVENMKTTDIDEQKSLKMKQINNLKQQMQELDKQIANDEEQLQKLYAQQKQSESQEISLKRAQLKKIKTDYNELDKQKNQIISTLDSLPKRLDLLQKEKKNYQSRITILEEDIGKLKIKQDKVEKYATQVYGAISIHEQEVMKLEEYGKQLMIILEEDNREVKESKKKIQLARQKVYECQRLIQEKQGDIQFVNDKIRMLQQGFREFKQQFPLLDELHNLEAMKLGARKSAEQQYQHSDEEKSNLSQTAKKQNKFPVQLVNSISPLEILSSELIESFLPLLDHFQARLSKHKAELDSIDSYNLQTLKLYYQKYCDYKKKEKDFMDVCLAMDNIKKKLNELKDKRMQLFRNGFGKINTKLKEVYRMLTKGGDAQLEIIDIFDPFSEGINFSVRPPKKAWKQITKLSGGQKTLSSLSLIFALHSYKPTPLYFMDEIDAALDYKNVSIVAQYIKKRTQDAQFIVISLRSNMFDMADKLVGIYKTFDQTKIINWCPERVLM